jgi:hypothetical protein
VGNTGGATGDDVALSGFEMQAVMIDDTVDVDARPAALTSSARRLMDTPARRCIVAGLIS